MHVLCTPYDYQKYKNNARIDLPSLLSTTRFYFYGALGLIGNISISPSSISF